MEYSFEYYQLALSMVTKIKIDTTDKNHQYPTGQKQGYMKPLHSLYLPSRFHAINHVALLIEIEILETDYTFGRKQI